MKFPVSVSWKIVLWVLLALLILGVALFVLLQKADPAHRWFGASFYLSSPVIGPVEDAPVVEKIPPLSPTLPPREGDLIKPDYGDAVNTYAGRHVQFLDCHGTPGSMVIKQGTTILLDNRDDAQITVNVGSTRHVIDAYDYVLTSVTQTGNLAITCNGGGAATLSVQP